MLRLVPLVLCVAISYGAVLHKRDIPVAVVYEKPQMVQSLSNLDAKIQLSGEELKQALKHLPNGESPENDQVQILGQAQDIIFNGIKTLRSKLDIEPYKPSSEEWDQLNTNLETLIEEQYRNTQVKQDQTPRPPTNQQNQFINSIAQGFQNLTTTFINNFQQNNQGSKPEDEQQGQPPNFIQSFLQNFQGGVNQVVNNINNLGQTTPPPSVSGDTGVQPTSDRPAGFINNIVSSVQQIIQGNNNPANALQGIGLNQSDTGTQPAQQQGGIFQGAFNQINQAINNIRPTPAPAVQGDEGTTPIAANGPVQILQSFTNQIGSLFGQGSNNNKPEDEAGGSTTSAPNIFQSIGNVIQGAINRPGGGDQGTNPVIAGASSGAQAVNNQIQQLVGGQAAGSPVESIQNALSGGSSTEKSGLQAEPVSTTQKEIMQAAE